MARAKAKAKPSESVENKEVIELLAKLNEQFKGMGLLEIALVNPKDCIAQKKNARYMESEKFSQLVNNVKRTRALESVPLVNRIEFVEVGTEPDTFKMYRYEIISGHHRIDAAKAAGLTQVLVMVMDNLDPDELISRQLSHNALAGLDDKAVLADLFDSIQNIELKIATGLQDEIAKIKYETLNFKIETFKEFNVLFLQEDEEQYEELMEKLLEEIPLASSASVRVTSMEYYDKFAKVVRRVKGIENIKSNGNAFMRMVELASMKLDEIKHEKEANEDKSSD